MRANAAVLFVAAFLSPSLTPAQGWTLSPQPTLSIGNDAGGPNYLFNGIGQLRRLHNGQILVTLGPDIRYYDADGKFATKAGGRGQGPGEFIYIGDVALLGGDSLLVMDIRRKVWLTPDGKFVRQEKPLKVAPLSDSVWYSENQYLLPGGALLGMQYRIQPNGYRPSTTPFRPPFRYSILDPTGTSVAPILTSGGVNQMRVGERSMVVVPFSPHPKHAIASDRVYVGDNDTTVVRAFSFEGKQVAAFPVADKAVPVTAADLEANRDQTLEWISATPNPSVRKAEFEMNWPQIPKPKRYPYWEQLLVDQSDNLWVSGPAKAIPAPITWTIFDRNGKRLGAISMPTGFTPRDIGRDYILGVNKDDDGVETIRMYKLGRPQ